MKWSKSHLFTLKETPADAEITSHKLMVRGGCIKKVGQGVYIYGHLALRSVRKFEQIIREEHEKASCVELLMPMVQPKELWEETGRWEEMGKGLLKFRNRLDQDWCLGATHEEVITDYVRGDIKSYRHLPVTLYQIQAKYRDEVRPRFGLLRGREFLMKDAYSFDVDEEAALKSYGNMFEVYKNIFSRLNVNFRVVDADSGNIGGSKSQEFHILAESGEDELMVSDSGNYAANVEVCPAIDAKPAAKKSGKEEAIEEFETPGLKTITDLSKKTGVPEEELVKTLFFSGSEDPKKPKPICILLRGSDEVNTVKLKSLLGLANPPEMLTEKEVKEVTGAFPGSCGPVGLKIPIYMDNGVENLENYIVGANKDGVHIKNVNHPRDFKVEKVADLRMAKAGDKNPEGEGLLESFRGIEVGHIFHLGTKYSKAMKASYLDKNGKARPIEMGCYGIGVSRTIQAAIEQNNDKDGIVWPRPIAPYTVHICLLDPKDKEITAVATKIYDELWAQGVDCLLDDRDERPGFKFKDADLIGLPLRVTVGGRGVKNNEIEVVERKTKEVSKVAVADTVSHILGWVNNK